MSAVSLISLHGRRRGCQSCCNSPGASLRACSKKSKAPESLWSWLHPRGSNDLLHIGMVPMLWQTLPRPHPFQGRLNGQITTRLHLIFALLKASFNLAACSENNNKQTPEDSWMFPPVSKHLYWNLTSCQVALNRGIKEHIATDNHIK